MRHLGDKDKRKRKTKLIIGAAATIGLGAIGFGVNKLLKQKAIISIVKSPMLLNPSKKIEQIVQKIKQVKPKPLSNNLKVYHADYNTVVKLNRKGVYRPLKNRNSVEKYLNKRK